MMRTEKMVRLVSEGHTFEEIGRLYGVSRQRVHQIVSKTGAQSHRAKGRWPVEVRYRRTLALINERGPLRLRICVVCGRVTFKRSGTRVVRTPACGRACRQEIRWHRSRYWDDEERERHNARQRGYHRAKREGDRHEDDGDAQVRGRQ